MEWRAENVATECLDLNSQKAIADTDSSRLSPELQLSPAFHNCVTRAPLAPALQIFPLTISRATELPPVARPSPSNDRWTQFRVIFEHKQPGGPPRAY